MFPACDLHRTYQTYIAERDDPNAHILIEALDHLIGVRLAGKPVAALDVVATRVIDQLVTCGADHRHWGSATRLTIYGVMATTTRAAGAAHLLANWQAAARRELTHRSEMRTDLRARTPHPHRHPTGAAA